ncbi:hypothetical protein [Geitlerinema sp. PCC 9228]|uniref:hypothetical protein n=1 Tax=Geitlerinema sp. PCC 9228 TaxID=111611 RepID=UPI0008F9C9E7|nr:hypothetical protein [Geitlerinema sp. PCC 9228]
MSKFRDAFDRLAQDEKNQDIDVAIRSWCDEIGYGDSYQQIKKELYSWIEDGWVVDNISKIYNQLLRSTMEYGKKNTHMPVFPLWDDLVGNPILQGAKDGIESIVKDTKNRIKKMDIKLILIIAFVLMSIGLVLWILKLEKEKKSNDKREIKTFPLEIERVPQGSQEKTIFLLILDAEGSKKIIPNLRSEGKITSEMVHILSSTSIIMALWQGTQEEFTKKELNKSFDCSPNSEVSEYDVYVVEIELAKREIEFERNANAMSRYNAFKRLANKPDSHKITKVSQRLPKEAYNNPHLYR